MSRYYLWNGGGMNLDECSNPDRVLEIMQRTYPDMREVTREEHDEAEQLWNKAGHRPGKED